MRIKVNGQFFDVDPREPIEFLLTKEEIEKSTFATQLCQIHMADEDKNRAARFWIDIGLNRQERPRVRVTEYSQRETSKSVVGSYYNR